MKTVVHSSLLGTPTLTRAHDGAMLMRRTLTTCSAGVLLGIAVLTGGCMEPAGIEGLTPHEAELDEEELDEEELDEEELDEEELDEAELDEAALDELTAEPSVMAACGLLNGYIAGEPSASFPETQHPVVGYKLANVLLQTDEWGHYFDYRIQFCNVSFSYTKTYYHYVFGIFAGEWMEPFPQYGPL